MKENNSKFFKTYFILMIIWAIIGLIDSLFITGGKETYGQINIVYALFIGTLEFAILVLSVISIVIFVKNKFSKISLVLPIYHIVAAILIFVYGVLWGLTSAIQGNQIANQSVTPELIVIGVILSLFELIFSGYVLNKFK